MSITDSGLNIIEGMANDRNRAEAYLLFYDEKLAAYNKEKEEALMPRGPVDENIGGGRSGIVSKPTEAMALKRVKYDEEHEEYLWLKAVEILQRSLGERKNIFIRVRRAAERQKGGDVGRPAWVVYTQMHYMKEIEDRFLQKEVSISEKTVKVWWRELVDRTVEIYLRLRW